VWLNGSFATSKDEPGDFDACWDTDGVDLDALDPVILDLSAGRSAQKTRYGGEFCTHDRRPAVITNEVQYRSTKAHLDRFSKTGANLEATLTKEPTSRLIQLELDAVRAQAEDLRGEIAEYERLRSGSVSTFEAASLADLPTLLVKARIARGWSHRRLGEALGVAEQQVQRYESSGYRSASLARICDVATALGVTMTERAELRAPNAA